MVLGVGLIGLQPVAWGGAPASPVPARAATQSGVHKIVAVGDSLTEGLGVAREQAYPAVLARRLAEKGRAIEVVNAGVSGARSSSGPSRVRWALKGNPDLIILELGANDGLQGGPTAEMKKNLSLAIEEAKSAGVKVLLAGMKAPPNMGDKYCRDFERVFKDLSHKHRVPLIPFFLEGVAADPKLNQPDMKHPTAEGYIRVVDNVMRSLEPML